MLNYTLGTSHGSGKGHFHCPLTTFSNIVLRIQSWDFFLLKGKFICPLHKTYTQPSIIVALLFVSLLIDCKNNTIRKYNIISNQIILPNIKATLHLHYYKNDL